MIDSKREHVARTISRLGIRSPHFDGLGTRDVDGCPAGILSEMDEVQPV